MSVDGSALGYQELLRLASSKGLTELEVTIVQVPGEVNRGHAVVTARARTASALYSSVGESWWDEQSTPRSPQSLVLAESRAKMRALCELVGMPQPIDATSRAMDARVGEAGGRSAQPAAQATVGTAQGQRPPTALSARRPDQVDLPASQGATPPRPDAQEPARVDAAEHDPATTSRAPDQAEKVRLAPVARPAPRSSVEPAEALGPDILQKLLQMTRQIGEFKHEELTEGDALGKLESFFQRAFNHSLAEGSRMEGQRVVQRLAADIARLAQESHSEATG